MQLLSVTFFRPTIRKHAKRISPSIVFVVAIISLHQDAAATRIVNLGASSGFSILSAALISDAGGASAINAGDVGLSPATGAAIGLLSNQVTGGKIYAVDAFGPLSSLNNPSFLTTAKNDLTTAYNDAAGRLATTTYLPVFDLGGLTLPSGVYNDPTSFGITGLLTLDAGNDPDAVWIFQTGSTLITATNSKVVFKDGIGRFCNVFWQVGSSATIGTYSVFGGHIMADQSIALQTGATLDGSAMARIGAVTLDHNTITSESCAVPETSSTLLLLGLGVASLSVIRWSVARREA